MAASKPKPLRFAALIRVSTEKQEKQGESLRTQKAEITADVKSLGGTIVEWYGGQEHATPGHETKEVDRLLAHAHKKKFDAVIVAHQDRWSRDNAKSKAGLEVLRSNGIRFFVGTQEYDLFNPTSKFFLGVSAEIGELTAGTQNQKSIKNRIARSKRGIPTAGKKPFGRHFNKVTSKWEIIDDKHLMIKDVAKRYLAGESMPTLAKEYGVNHANLNKVLSKRCGDTWTETFDYPEFNIHEVVTHKIPRLLPEKTIAAIRKKATLNKTWSSRNSKFAYLLSHYVYCSHCEYLLSGQTNHANTKFAKKSYYRHPHASRGRPCTVPKSWVDAKLIERLVVADLFEMFGNPLAVERAIKRAIPNQGEVVELQKQQDQIKAAIAKTAGAKQRIVKLAADGVLSADEVKEQITVLREQESKQREQLQKIDDKLDHLPSSDSIRTLATEVVEQLQAAMFPTPRDKRKVPPLVYDVKGKKLHDFSLDLKLDQLDNDPDAIDNMTYDDKRALIESVFTGNTKDGKPAGVYIEWETNENDVTRWKYSIRGIIEPKRIVNAKGKRGRSQNALH